MPELELGPVQTLTKARMTTEHDPALWRTAMLRFHDHMTRSGGVFHVGIPPSDRDFPEATSWIWHSESEIAVFPPVSFRLENFGQDRTNSGVVAEQIVNEHVNLSISHEKRSWREPVADPFVRCNTINWPQSATALLAPERLIHGWDPQWDDAAPASVAGRSGMRVPLVLTLPWSDPRSYGDEFTPDWMHLFTETAEVVIDDEHGVILEWNGLIDGQVFERNAFTAIDFDAPLTACDFDPDALGLTKL